MKQFIYNFRKCMQFLGNKKFPYIIAIFGGNVIGSFCYNIVLAIIIQKVIDAVAYKNINSFIKAIEWASISFAVAFTIEPVLKKIKNYCVTDVSSKLRLCIVEKICVCSVREFENKNSADILSRVTQDVDKIEEIYVSLIPNVFFALMHGGTACVIMLYYNFYLGLLSIFIGVISTFVNIIVSRKIQEYADNRQQKYSIVLKKVIELLDGMTDINMSQSQSYFEYCFQKELVELGKEELKTELEIKKSINFQNIFGQANNIVVMMLGIIFAFNGYITVGAITAIINLQGNAIYLFQNISEFISKFANAMPSLNRIMEIVDNESMVESEEMNEAKRENKSENVLEKTYYYSLELKNISFAYVKEDKILENISLKVENGEFVALIGESGKGKSTLAKILLSFYKITGDYFIFGENVKLMTDAEKRSQIAYMDQENTLFSMSILDNLRLVNANATNEEIIRVCKSIGAHEFIMKLPEQYNYVINDNYDNLSDGQKQRLTLARMILSDRPIFLIDEGTANLDINTEKAIINNLKKFKGEKTILFITHHDYVKNQADVIISL